MTVFNPQFEKEKILLKAKNFFKQTIAPNHLSNLKKLTSLRKFKYNPFLWDYLSRFLTGNNNARGLAQALIYPRILGTSINTSFGENMQHFCSTVLSSFGSAIPGIDLEFIDQVEKRKKYCQVKIGPNTINKDDVTTISNHFESTRNIARINHLEIGLNDLIVGVLYGEFKDLSANYKRLNRQYPVYAGEDFWRRLTGDKDFYFDLIKAFGEVAEETSAKELLETTIAKLAENIQKEVLEKKLL
jgi:hypothetical protein